MTVIAVFFVAGVASASLQGSRPPLNLVFSATMRVAGGYGSYMRTLGCTSPSPNLPHPNTCAMDSISDSIPYISSGVVVEVVVVVSVVVVMNVADGVGKTIATSEGKKKTSTARAVIQANCCDIVVVCVALVLVCRAGAAGPLGRQGGGRKRKSLAASAAGLRGAGG